ncbi:MAG: peptidoglycan editing factor PgeF [Firmicutes bacterium]|nr:peptidoglycan editing factor PgeF [Bacillota bacterium]
MGDGEEMEFLTFPSLEETGLVKHLFTTRLGGVSHGEFSTMNLSFTRGDRSACVAENYRRIGEALGCVPEDMVASHQTHTTNIRRVGLEDRGKGITRPRDYEEIDGLMTDASGIVLVTYFADCVPLFFVDTVHRAIGLAHSGWRGTVAGMGSCMVRAMGEAYGTQPGQLRAAIGPSICAGCYEVGEEVAEQFGRFQGVVTPGKEPGKYQLDLWEANRQILVEAGVRKEEIAVTDICTCCNDSYLFSHRASRGKRGNMGAFLCLR